MLSETRQVLMRNHINYFCKLYRLDKLYVSTIDAAEIWVQERMLWVPKIEGILSYFVALHEIGHYAIRNEGYGKLDEEAQAWLWAFDKAQFKPNKPVHRRIVNSFGLYRKHSDEISILFDELYQESKSRVEVKGKAG